MILREELRRRLLEERGIYVKECCDKCGQLLGSVRYTRLGESGVWCSRECRGIVEQPAIRKGGRPRKHVNGAQKQKAYRERILAVTKPPCTVAETKDLRAQKSPHSRYPLTRPSVAQESPLCEFGGSEAARAAKTIQQRDYRSRLSVETTVCRRVETKGWRLGDKRLSPTI